MTIMSFEQKQSILFVLKTHHIRQLLVDFFWCQFLGQSGFAEKKVAVIGQQFRAFGLNRLHTWLSFVLLICQLDWKDFGVVDNFLERLITNSQETGIVAESVIDKGSELCVHQQQLLDVFFAVLETLLNYRYMFFYLRSQCFRRCSS